MKNDQRHDFVQIQSQLNYFKFTTERDFGPLVSLLIQFVRQPSGGLRALMDAATIGHLLEQPVEFFREAFRQYHHIRFYVYARDSRELPSWRELAASPLAALNADVEVCCFESSDLECCLFYTEDQLLALQDSDGKKVGFVFPREWPFINDYANLIERMATLCEPVLHYSNRVRSADLLAEPPRN